MTATSARTICYFVPPYVQAALSENVDGAAADASQQALSDAARERRAAAISGATPDAGPTLAPAATGTSRREVYDSGNTTNQRVKLVRPEGSPETKDPEVINAYDSAGQVRTYFKQVLNRDSIDNRALDLVLNVHFGTNFNNAFWDGDEMTFGDGDGVVFSGFARSLDVVAHELAHGVTQFASGLVYQNESGALNEHFSDVFGTAITQWANHESPEDADWLIGDEIMGPDLYGGPCGTRGRRTTTRSSARTRSRRTTATATPGPGTTVACTSTRASRTARSTWQRPSSATPWWLRGSGTTPCTS